MISILMSVYNEKNEWIDAAISSIIAQDYRDWELIVVNDNPENVEVTNFLAKICDNQKIKLILNPSNLGLARSLNKAFNASSGEYIARMDADDISLPDRFSTEMAIINNQMERIDFLSAGVIEIDENGTPGRNRKNIQLNNESFRDILRYGNISVHPTWLMRRTVFETIDGYRNFPNSQDYDFLSRLSESEFRIFNSESVVLKYRVRRNNMGGLRQFIVGKYIQELNKQRRMGGRDEFSEKKLQSLLNLQVKDFDRYRKVNYYFRTHDNSILNVIKKCFLGLTVSKYFRAHLISRMKFRLKIRQILAKGDF